MHTVSLIASAFGLVAGLACTAMASEPIAAGGVATLEACSREPLRGSNGSRPEDELVRQLIVCLWQRPAYPGIAGAVTVQIDAVEIASARAWGEPSDVGLGYLHTRVWPVTARYLKQSERIGQVNLEQGRAAFNCFVNTGRHWQCMFVERLADAPMTTQTVSR